MNAVEGRSGGFHFLDVIVQSGLPMTVFSPDKRISKHEHLPVTAHRIVVVTEDCSIVNAFNQS